MTRSDPTFLRVTELGEWVLAFAGLALLFAALYAVMKLGSLRPLANWQLAILVVLVVAALASAAVLSLESSGRDGAYGTERGGALEPAGRRGSD